MNERVELSAQCRSSMTSSTGSSSESACSTASRASNTVDCATCSEAAPPPTPGRIASRAERSWGARAWREGSPWRTRGRRAVSRGAYGSSSSPSSTQSPERTRAPASRACLASSSASRDLPTPDSPPTKARDGRDPMASSSAARSSASSALRPTKRSLVMRVAIVRGCQPPRLACDRVEAGVDVDGVEAGVHDSSFCGRLHLRSVDLRPPLAHRAYGATFAHPTPYLRKCKPYLA